MSASAGFGLDNEISKTEQYMYILNAEAASTARFYKFNVRAALTVSAGATTSAYVYRTGQASATGTITTVANGRICTIAHAPASGDKSYLFTTTTRIYRCSIGSIVDGGTSFLTDAMVEIPPGTTTTYPANATMYGVDYSDSIDRLIITTNAAPFRMYVASYKVDGLTAFEKIFAGDLARLKSSTTSANVATPLQSRAVSVLNPESQQGGGPWFSLWHLHEVQVPADVVIKPNKENFALTWFDAADDHSFIEPVRQALELIGFKSKAIAA
jgi:hypothetical protein